MIKRILLNFLGVWALLVASATAVGACAVCLTGFGEDSVAEAFNWSVLFLMATPYLVMGSIFGWLFYRYRQSAARGQPIKHPESCAELTWKPKESER